MSDSFQLPIGVSVSDLTGVHEAYSTRLSERGYTAFTINVSAENVARTFLKLAGLVCTPGFFVLETGTSRDVEEELRKSGSDPWHMDVHYLDGLDWDQGEAIFREYEALLVNDGMVNFGFGSHSGHDEVYVKPYKVFNVYADDPQKYHAALAALGCPEEDKVETVWRNISRSTPGQLTRLEHVDPDIYDMLEALEARGLRLAERRDSR